MSKTGIKISILATEQSFYDYSEAHARAAALTAAKVLCSMEFVELPGESAEEQVARLVRECSEAESRNRKLAREVEQLRRKMRAASSKHAKSKRSGT